MNEPNTNESHIHVVPACPRRALRWFGVIMGVLVLALVVIRVTQGQRTRAYLETIRKSGLPATLDDLQAFYATPPNEENAALKLLEAADAKFDPGADLQPNLPVLGKARLPEAGAGLHPEPPSASPAPASAPSSWS